MANNVDITNGSGTTVATDQVGSAHVQLVKLVDGTEDSAARISGDATNGLDVDVTRLPALPAGSNVIGKVRGMGGWTKNHAPAVATQATISQAAGGSNVVNVCTSITISLASAAAPTVGVVTFNLRDGATGAGTVLWTTRLSLPAVAGEARSLSLPCWIEGTANTAMTLETSAAPAANVQATVAMTGTTI